MFSFVKKALALKFVRFILVGGLNTLFGYGLYALLIFIGLHYSLASLLGTILGVLFNFKTTGVIVFKSRDNKLIFKFFAVYGVIYLINLLGLYIFDLLVLDAYLAGAMLLLPMAVLAYWLNKKLVFDKVNY